MQPFLGVPFGQRPQPPLTLFQKEASRRWSSKGGTTSPWVDARAESSSECVTVLGPREAKETDGGGANSRGANDGGGAAEMERASGMSVEVLVRFTVQDEQPEVCTYICRPQVEKNGFGHVRTCCTRWSCHTVRFKCGS